MAPPAPIVRLRSPHPAAGWALVLPLVLVALAPSREAGAVVGSEVLPAPPPVPSTAYAASARNADEGDDPSAALARLPFVPGRLIVKMKPTTAECLDCVHARGRKMGDAIGAPGLDALNLRFGLRGVRPLRGADAALGTLGERRRAEGERRARRAAAALAAGRPVDPDAAPDTSSIYVFELSPWLDMAQAAREYAADPSVAWAEPDGRAQVQLVPNDPYFASSGAWGQPYGDLWGLERIDAAAAWDTTRGAGVVVAVIDTGIDYFHTELAPNVWTSPGDVADNGIDDDGNGYVDDALGWNFVADSSDVFDDHGHGTHCAGTIAAAGQDGLGIIGVAYEARIMGVKGLDRFGFGEFSQLAEAVLYAAENGADVINASWGGLGTSSAIDEAIDTAHALGVLFVASAGNHNLDVEENGISPVTPAAHPRAVAVAAFDHLDQKAFFSNFGAKIEVAAPGGGDAGNGFEAFRSILSLRSSGAGTDMTGNGRLVVDEFYSRQAGTSMAAPHVAGVAALVRSLHPSYTVSQVRQALRVGADDVGTPGDDLQSGHGRVNAAASVALAALDVEIDSPASGTVVTGTQVSIVGNAGGAGFASYVVEVGEAPSPTAWTTIAGPIAAPVIDGELALWDLAEVPDGDYVVRVRATSSAGIDFEESVRLTLDHVLLSEPAPNVILRPTGPLAIGGTAAGGAFESFRVEWRTITPDYAIGPWRSDGIALTGGGASPVTDGVLATLDTALFPGNVRLDLRVVVVQDGEEIVEDRRNVVLDPTLRPGWPQKLPGLPQFASIYKLMNHVTIADLDQDGSKEVLAAYGDMVYAFRHDGTPMPGWPRTLDAEPAPVFMRRSPAAADLDGDGLLEVVAADSVPASGHGATNHPNHNIYVWHADGTPMAGWPRPFRRAYSLDPNDPNFLGGGPRGDVVLSDIDDDGRRDIVAVVGPAVFAIDADGGILPGWPQTFPLVWPCLAGQECIESLLAVGDVDGDRKKEIAVVVAGTKNDTDSPAQTLILYRHDGTILKGFPRKLTSLHYGPSVAHFAYTNAPIFADLDGDGDLEVIAATGTTKVGAFHHTGRPVSLRPRKAVGTDNRACPLRIPPMLEPPTAGDLDGDGAAELLVGTHAKEWLWKPSGRGTSVSICLAQTGGPDFINVMRAGRVPALSGWPVAIPFPRGDHSYGPGPTAIGDIDGDLRPEVVSGAGICGHFDPPYRFEDHVCFPIHAFDAGGNLLPGFPKSSPYPGPTNGVTPAIGDLDGDGLKEIVWVDFAGQILVWDVAGTPAPEAMQWPMFRHDPGHTGALVADP